jgi:hypothetical protein
MKEFSSTAGEVQNHASFQNINIMCTVFIKIHFPNQRDSSEHTGSVSVGTDTPGEHSLLRPLP